MAPHPSRRANDQAATGRGRHSGPEYPGGIRRRGNYLKRKMEMLIRIILMLLVFPLLTALFLAGLLVFKC
jgi:hypothetical protein